MYVPLLEHYTEDEGLMKMSKDVDYPVCWLLLSLRKEGAEQVRRVEGYCVSPSRTWTKHRRATSGNSASPLRSLP